MKPTLVLFFSVAFAFGISAQPAVQFRHPGVVLYEQGHYSDAVSSLEKASRSKEYKSNAEIWNYLGLAYFATAEFASSVRALEKSADLNKTSSMIRENLAYAYLADRQVKKAHKGASEAISLDPNNATAYHIRARASLGLRNLDDAERDADRLLELNPTNPRAYILRSDVILAEFTRRVGEGSSKRVEARLVKNAIEVLESGIAKTRGAPNYKALEHVLASMQIFYESYTREPDPSQPPAKPDPRVTPYRILSKSRPLYTHQARQDRISGTVRVSVILGADAKVSYVLFLNRLDYGLEVSVLEAARGIRFEPKRVDGKPVPVVVTIEYGFNTD